MRIFNVNTFGSSLAILFICMLLHVVLYTLKLNNNFVRLQLRKS